MRVTATVWAGSSFGDDKLDLYYTANAHSDHWTPIGTFTPPGAGAQTITATYTLPQGRLQAVRANFRSEGSASPCSEGAHDDHDDLISAVAHATPPAPPDASPRRPTGPR